MGEMLGYMERRYIVLGLVVLLSFQAFGFWKAMFEYNLFEVDFLSVKIMLGLAGLYVAYMIKSQKF